MLHKLRLCSGHTFSKGFPSFHGDASAIHSDGALNTITAGIIIIIIYYYHSEAVTPSRRSALRCGRRSNIHERPHFTYI